MFEWTPPAHGTVAFPHLTTGEPIDAFCNRCVREAGVLLLPATVYDHKPSTRAVRGAVWVQNNVMRCHRDTFVLAWGGTTLRSAWKHWRRICSVALHHHQTSSRNPVHTVCVTDVHHYAAGCPCKRCMSCCKRTICRMRCV